jgi:hypothetical protein
MSNAANLAAADAARQAHKRNMVLHPNDHSGGPNHPTRTRPNKRARARSAIMPGEQAYGMAGRSGVFIPSRVQYS